MECIGKDSVRHVINNKFAQSPVYLTLRKTYMERTVDENKIAGSPDSENVKKGNAGKLPGEFPAVYWRFFC